MEKVLILVGIIGKVIPFNTEHLISLKKQVHNLTARLIVIQFVVVLNRKEQKMRIEEDYFALLLLLVLTAFIGAEYLYSRLRSDLLGNGKILIYRPFKRAGIDAGKISKGVALYRLVDDTVAGAVDWFRLL